MIDKIIIIIGSLTIGYLLGWLISSHQNFQRNIKNLENIELRIKEIEQDIKNYNEKYLSKPTGYFNLFKDKKGEWRFNILASNFKVIAVSEGYDSRRNAIGGIKSLHKTMNGLVKFKERK